MKITKVESFIVHAPIGLEIADSHYRMDHWGFVGLMILTDQGVVGTGYTGTHCAGDEMIKQTIDQYFKPMLLGENPLYVKRLWDKLHGGNLHQVGRTGLTRLAHSAVDIALWDICAKAAALPLWALLGGAKAGQAIHTYNTNVGWLHFSTSELIANVERAVEAGWTGVKIKVGSPNPAEDVSRIRELRKRFGDSLTIMIDGNEGWDFNTAMYWGKRLEPYAPYWFEEPIHADDIEGHAVLARELAIPIAVGENLMTRFAFRDYVKARAVEFLQPDVTRVGGITEWLKIANLADCYNLPVVPHSGDMMQIHQHLVGATQNSPLLEYIPWGQELFIHPAKINKGFLGLPTEPGASTDMLPETMARYRVA
jgi:L-alanine-DL-glutamate epimerase-like enolase superfamily enzyme